MDISFHPLAARIYREKITWYRIITISLLMLTVIILLPAFRNPASPVEETINKYYTIQLGLLKTNILHFKLQAARKIPVTQLRVIFKESRLVYKRIAILTEYYNPYETKVLNSPAIDRIESEVADRIIHPKGYQAIEQILFAEKWIPDHYNQLKSLLDEMLGTIQKLETEPDRQYKFRIGLVWDAMRAAVVQVTSTGITGFDSPVAGNSLPEAAASLQGIRSLLELLRPALSQVPAGKITELDNLLSKTGAHLKGQINFNQFDRLGFITSYINPLYEKVITLRNAAGVPVPEGRSAINYMATSIFDKETINLNFYSPPQEYWVTPERVQLGKQLFSDPILSGPHTRSCASCHKPELAFTDGLAKPFALDGKTVLPRNTPTLWNSGFQTRQFMDSRADILENQLGEVVHNLQEMEGSLKKSVADLKNIPAYKLQFEKAYPGEKEPLNAFTIANAISSYVRSLRSLDSRFDQYMRGNRSRLTAAEKNGFNLFAGKAKCATCHFIPLFNGVVPPFYAVTESEVVGVPATKDKKQPVLDTDEGKYIFTRSEIHKYSFKTPSLRNIELTAPYMHNGVYDSLEEVMEFYNNGGGKGLHIAPSNQTLPFDKLKLTKKEISDIVLFMKSLTDTSSVLY